MNTLALILDRRRWLLLLLVLMAAFVFPQAAQAWWDCNWSARTPVLIAKPASTLTNYTLEVMLLPKDLPGYDWTRLDADIRVIDADDKTALTFFVQPRASGTQVVRLWVLFPTLSAGKTIYIYYGNKTAVTASSGATTFATAATGTRVWTRQFGGTAFTSEAQSYAAWNAGNDSVAGYGCAISKAFISTSNSGLFGSGSNISWNISSIVYVSPAQAGNWGIRWGPDLGLGGALFIDDVPAQIAWGSDLWWGGSWTDATQLLQGTITLTAGYHVIRAIGNEGCCDGPQQIDLKAPGAGSWSNLATGNYVASAPSCQLALATPQTAQTPGSTASCGAVHFQISNASTGLYCLNQAVTVTVVDASNNPVTSYSGTMALSTTTGKGTWTLSSGTGTFADPVANDGAATYQWPGNSATATFALSYRSGSNPVTVNAVDQTNATLLDDGTQSAMTFAPSGFTVTSAPFSNPAGGVPAFASPQTAGNNVSVYLTAYGQNPTDATCGIITNYTGAKALKFWSTYVNPASGTRTASINATTIATAEAGAAAQSVTFTSGQATVTAVYKDAGSMILSMKDDTTGNPSLPNGIRGSTGTFVWKPANFVVSNIKRTSDSFANPAASTASGTVFIGAGQAFTATVTAVESGGTATPNFGRESPAESVKFDVSLVLPASGNAPSVGGTIGAFTNGVATGTVFTWAEVGIVKLLPRVSDGNYLASGDVVGSLTGNVGRFIPDNFAVSLNTPVFGTGCGSGPFSYVGQPFTYTVAPVISVTARALGGTTTQNYTGSLFRLTNASLTNRTYTPTPASPTLNLSALPAATGDPAIVDLGAGKASLTFSAGAGISFTRGAAIAAFNANIALSINVLDLDAVAGPNPVIFGSGSGISFNTSAEQRYGRLYLRNSVGSELLDLPLPLTLQYYSGGAQGFITNVADSCTAAPTLAFSGYQGNLVAGETCVRDSGSPGVSGVGCSAAAASGSRYLATAVAGSFNLNLSAPGSANNGALTVTATAPLWLQYLWNASSGIPSNPAAMATFRLFPGPTQRIYQREVY